MSKAPSKMEAPRRRGRPPGHVKKALDAETSLASEEVVSNRPPMRPEMRAEDPRSRAAARAKELRDHLGSLDEGTDEFYFDPNNVPDGWSYEWKTRLVLGQENPAQQVALRRTGWEAVPVSRHPEMMPNGAVGHIERKGMVLMERPKEITDEVRNLDYRNARNQVRSKEQQLNSAPDGQFGRDHSQAQPKISKSYEPIPIPSDR